MKPTSLRWFDVLFPLATVLVLISAGLSFSSLEARALLGFGGEGDGARGMAIWMVIASLFIFLLLASIIWATISQMRMGFMRYPLALVAVYSLFQSCQSLAASGPHLAGFVDCAACLVAGASAALLFRKDARQCFRQPPGDSVVL